jgi:hypothetical protein
MITLRGGDVYLDGRRWQKTLDEERALGVLVHDDNNRAAPRWLAEPDDGRWERQRDCGEGSGYVFQERGDHDGGLAWLTYHHLRTNDVPGAADRPAGVLDDDPYNARLSRQLNDAFDLRLRASLTWRAPGLLVIRAHDGWRSWDAELDARRGEVRLVMDGQPRGIASRAMVHGRRQTLELSLCDGETRLALDGAVVLAAPIPEGSEPRIASATPFALGASGRGVCVSHMAIYRDVYWLNPWNSPAAWETGKTLVPVEYFVLGDNPAASTDSRHFGAIGRGQIRGLVRPRAAATPSR